MQTTNRLLLFPLAAPSHPSVPRSFYNRINPAVRPTLMQEKRKKVFFSPLSAQFPSSHVGIYILLLGTRLALGKLKSKALYYRGFWRDFEDSLLESSPAVTMKGLSGFCECLELLQIFLGMWLRQDFQLNWQDQIKIKAFLLLWQVHMIKPPNCETYWSRRCERATGSTDPEFIPPGDPGDSLIPVFQELHAESGSSQSSAGTSHGITPGFTSSSACATPGLALCIYRQSFPHGSTMEKAPALKFQWEGFNPTLNSPPRALCLMATTDHVLSASPSH